MTEHNSNEMLKSIINRINDHLDAIDDEKEAVSALYSEAKGNGLDAKALRVVVKRMHEDADKRRELEETVEMYTKALGGLSDLPLGQAAIERVMTAG